MRPIVSLHVIWMNMIWCITRGKCTFMRPIVFLNAIWMNMILQGDMYIYAPDSFLASNVDEYDIIYMTWIYEWRKHGEQETDEHWVKEAWRTIRNNEQWTLKVLFYMKFSMYEQNLPPWNFIAVNICWQKKLHWVITWVIDISGAYDCIWLTWLVW